MTHSVQLIIGRDEAVSRFIGRWPRTRAVALQGGWRAVPVDDDLADQLNAAWPGAGRPDALDMAPAGLMEALAEATRPAGALAYVETEYFGGTGGQSAVAFANGRLALSPMRSKQAFGSINSALRAIGVERAGAQDEFDTIGLGARRTMDDYAPEGPRRLRAAPEALRADRAAKGLPLWMVIVVIVLAIAMGVGVLES